MVRQGIHRFTQRDLSLTATGVVPRLIAVGDNRCGPFIERLGHTDLLPAQSILRRVHQDSVQPRRGFRLAGKLVPSLQRPTESLLGHFCRILRVGREPKCGPVQAGVPPVNLFSCPLRHASPQGSGDPVVLSSHKTDEIRRNSAAFSKSRISEFPFIGISGNLEAAGPSDLTMETHAPLFSQPSVNPDGETSLLVPAISGSPQNRMPHALAYPGGGLRNTRLPG